MPRIVTPTMPSTTKQTPPPMTVPKDKIAKRAYEKWVKRGYQHGHDMKDWLEAEAELKAEASRSASSSTRR